MLKSIFSQCLSKQEQLELLKIKTAKISNICKPKQILLIGSASRLEMTTTSDVDFVVIFEDNTNFKPLRLALSLARKEDPWPQDVFFIQEREYLEKSKQGGLYWVAATEGIEVYPHFRIEEKI